MRESGSKGIHWHIGQELTYVATDDAKQKIPWVQVKDKDGKVTQDEVHGFMGVAQQ